MARELVKRTSHAVDKSNGKERVIVPDVDIIETDAEYHLYADLPGVDEKSLEVTIEKEILTIKGKAQEDIPEGYALRSSEYSSGSYERSFTLTDDINRDEIKASIKNGVLKLVLPKAETAKAKKIQITQE